jgi:lipopolysaccharide export LptBFGC system permease protein LptF
MGRSIAAYLIWQVTVRLVIVIGIMLGIFLAEKAGGVMGAIAETQSSMLLLVAFLSLQAPKILGIALPTGLLIAIYTAVLEMREHREMVALAASGTSTRFIIIVLIGFGALCQILALVTSGYLEPQARFTERVLYHSLKHRLVEAGLPADEFHSLGPYTIYARDRGPDGILHQVLIFQRESADQKEKQTLTTASVLGFAEAGEAGMLKLNLHDVSQYTFVEQPIANHRGLTVEVGNEFEAREYQRTLSFDDLVESNLGQHGLGELTLGELIRPAAAGGRGASAIFSEAAARIVGSLLCLLAVPLALLAVSCTNIRTQYIALPLACGGLLLLNVLLAAATASLTFRTLSQVAVMLTAYGLVTAAFSLAAFLMGSIPGLVKPQLAVR